MCNHFSSHEMIWLQPSFSSPTHQNCIPKVVRKHAQVDAEVSELQPQISAQRHRRKNG
jgi:hypothetical protein